MPGWHCRLARQCLSLVSETVSLFVPRSTRQMSTSKEWEMQHTEVLDQLESLADPQAVQGMARYGINPDRAFGVSIPNLRKIARNAGKDHELAGELWSSGIHEARILASMVEDPGKVTEELMDRWAADFNSWDLCDQCCNNLFRKTPFAHSKALEWSSREEEYVKRAGFALMASLAVHDKDAGDDEFLKFLPVIETASTDQRNYVKKAVNWALRQIGKRNRGLNGPAVALADKLKHSDSKAARWIGSDAFRELTGDAVMSRLGP